MLYEIINAVHSVLGYTHTHPHALAELQSIGLVSLSCTAEVFIGVRCVSSAWSQAWLLIIVLILFRGVR